MKTSHKSDKLRKNKKIKGGGGGSTNQVPMTLIVIREFIFTLAEIVEHNLYCQIRPDDNSSTCTFTTEKSVTCTGACANELIPNR